MNIRSLVKQPLIARQNRKYTKSLNARKMTYACFWQMQQAELQKLRQRQNQTGAGTKEQGHTLFSWKDYVIFMATAGWPAEGYLDWLEDYLSQNPQALLVYGDEDAKEPDGSLAHPYFKPDWSPDLLDCTFYLGSVVVVRRELLKQAGGDDAARQTMSESPEIRILSEKEQELIRCCAHLAGGYEKRKGAQVIGHVARILFHCSSLQQLQEYAVPKTVTGGSNALPKVSVIIPSKDHPELLRDCLRAITHTGQGVTYEIVVVDNGSRLENRQECQKLTEQMQCSGVEMLYLYEPMDFHFSRMCNLGAEKATGELLLFLNDDVELAEPDTLAEMARLAGKPYEGAVGLKLYYPEGKRMQHAGITNLPMGPVHKLQFLEDDENYYFYRNAGTHNLLAVTAACLMVSRDKFCEAGGFPEDLAVAFNDVSLCFRLYELGYYNSCICDKYAYHHESLSRGADEESKKLRRLMRERRKLYEKHPALEGVDPYYSKHLNRIGLDVRIRPAYEQGGNHPQKIEADTNHTHPGGSFTGYRYDNCLMLRVEMCTPEEILGYGVVLGDDNSCYRRSLLFLPLNREEQENLPDMQEMVRRLQQENRPVLKLPIEGQYRPDLVENLPDQKLVGLSGFWFRYDGTCRMPAGSYLVGMVAEHAVTGTRLIQMSNREWIVESD